METIKPKKTLTEETYDILVNAICTGELTPGERLTQDEIAARLNVSRQPVNSAISILKTKGLVVDTGRRGVTVAELDPDLFASIFEYRLVIEPFAARIASERDGKHARAEAQRLLKAGQAALNTGDIAALVNADMRFHEAIYRWGRNDVILASMQTNWHHIRRAMADVLRHPGLQKDSWDDHAAIAEAIVAGDGESAAERMQSHIRTAYDRTMRTIRARA